MNTWQYPTRGLCAANAYSILHKEDWLLESGLNKMLSGNVLGISLLILFSTSLSMGSDSILLNRSGPYLSFNFGTPLMVIHIWMTHGQNESEGDHAWDVDGHRAPPEYSREAWATSVFLCERSSSASGWTSWTETTRPTAVAASASRPSWTFHTLRDQSPPAARNRTRRNCYTEETTTISIDN